MRKINLDQLRKAYAYQIIDILVDLNGGELDPAEQETCREIIVRIRRQIIELEEAIGLPQPDAITG